MHASDVDFVAGEVFRYVAQQAGAVLRADFDVDGEHLGTLGAAPCGGQHFVGRLAGEVLQLGAAAAVDGNAPPARDEAGDVVGRRGFAAFGQYGEQAAFAVDEDAAGLAAFDFRLFDDAAFAHGRGRATHRHNRTVARQHNRMQGRFMMSTQYHYAGIDIAKRNFVIAVSSLSKTKTETNNPKGIAHTVEYLKKHNVALVVMESTGGLEIPAAKAIHRAGIAVIIANPRQTHQFAQSQSLTKTDAKDAQMLAFFAQMTAQKEGWQTRLYHPPTEAEEVLEALVNRRNQLVDMRTAEKNRLHQVHETQVESVKQLIAHFDRLIDELDKQIDDHTHTHFDGKAQVAEQIKGIGSITTATLMAMLPELGRLNHKRLASLVGIAPHPRESGETKFKSRCFGGRSAVRKALYMATVVATRFEPLIRDFYQRLLSKGKPYHASETENLSGYIPWVGGSVILTWLPIRRIFV